MAAMVGKPKATAIVLLLFLGLSGCRERDDLRKVRLWAQAPPEVTPLYEGDVVPLRFAIALTTSPQEGLRLYGELAEQLERMVGRPVHLMLRRTFSEVNDLVRSRQAEVVTLCHAGFLQGRADFGLEALAIPVVSGLTSYPSYFVVSAGSDVRSVTELSGRIFAFSQPPCLPDGRFLPMGPGKGDERQAGFFRQSLRIHSHDRAIQAVAEGLVEGALVDGLVYERTARNYPGEAGKTRVIARTAPYGNPPIAVHPRLDPLLKEALRAGLLTLHEGETGRALLDRLGIDRFITPPSGRGR